MAIGIEDHTFAENELYNSSSFMTSMQPNVFITGTHTHLGRNLIVASRHAGYQVHTVCPPWSNTGHPISQHHVDLLYRLGCTTVALGDATNPPDSSAFSKCAFAVHCAAAYSDDDGGDCRTARFLARCAAHVFKVVVVSSCTVLLDPHATPVRNAHERDTLPDSLTWLAQQQQQQQQQRTCLYRQMSTLLSSLLPFSSSMTAIPSHTVAALRQAESVAWVNRPKVIIVRPALVWGGCGDPFTRNLTFAALAGRLRLVDHGLFRTSTCHVLNACAGILAALRVSRESPLASYVYFVSDGNDKGDDESSHSQLHSNTTSCRRRRSLSDTVHNDDGGADGAVNPSRGRNANRYRDFVSAVLLNAGVPGTERKQALRRSLPLWLVRRLMQVTRWMLKPCQWLQRRLWVRGRMPTPVQMSLKSLHAAMCDSAVCRVGTEVTVCDDLARSTLGYRNVVSVREGIEMLRHSILPLPLSGVNRAKA